MTWTTPRTWVTSELVTASLMNTQLRDNLNYLHSGKECFYLPAAVWRPATSNGCGGISQTEHTAQQAETVYLAFNKDADEHAIFAYMMPLKWNLGPISFQVNYSAAAGGTSTVEWGLAGVSNADNEGIDAGLGTFVTVSDTLQTGADEQYTTAESGAVTIAGTPANNEMINFDLMRDVSEDSLAEDAWFQGMRIFYTSDQHFEA